MTWCITFKLSVIRVVRSGCRSAPTATGSEDPTGRLNCRPGCLVPLSPPSASAIGLDLGDSDLETRTDSDRRGDSD